MSKTKQSDAEAQEKGFLNRWSERKRSATEQEAADGDPLASDTALQAGVGEDSSDQEPPLTEEEVAALPDPQAMTETSDFTPFLRDGVPENLKRLALRRLWRVNPVIGHVDGLLDYDLDYTDAATVVKNLQTLYQVGKGMVLPEDEEVSEAFADEPRAADVDSVVQESEEETGSPNESQPSDATSHETAAQKEENHLPGGDTTAQSEAIAADILEDFELSTKPKAVAVPAGQEKFPLPGQAIKRRWGSFS